MILRVLGLVFLFLLKLRFPGNKSVAEFIRKRYSADAVIRLRKFEKLDFEIRKNEADLEFLQMCHHEGLTPKFLNFKLANSGLKHSRTYKQCQSMLLKEDIKSKSSIISKQKKEFEIVRNSIKRNVSLFDFAHLSCLFLVGNDGKLVKIKQVHRKKLHALGKDSSIGTHDPNKVIFNYSSHRLSDVEKNLLVRGLNFVLSPMKLNYGDLTPFELLFRDVTMLSIFENVLERQKFDIAFSLYDNYSFGMNLTSVKRNM